MWLVLGRFNNSCREETGWGGGVLPPLRGSSNTRHMPESWTRYGYRECVGERTPLSLHGRGSPSGPRSRFTPWLSLPVNRRESGENPSPKPRVPHLLCPRADRTKSWSRDLLDPHGRARSRLCHASTASGASYPTRDSPARRYTRPAMKVETLGGLLSRLPTAWWSGAGRSVSLLCAVTRL
jgi:hypothetical protein